MCIKWEKCFRSIQPSLYYAMFTLQDNRSSWSRKNNLGNRNSRGQKGVCSYRSLLYKATTLGYRKQASWCTHFNQLQRILPDIIDLPRYSSESKLLGTSIRKKKWRYGPHINEPQPSILKTHTKGYYISEKLQLIFYIRASADKIHIEWSLKFSTQSAGSGSLHLLVKGWHITLCYRYEKTRIIKSY